MSAHANRQRPGRVALPRLVTETWFFPLASLYAALVMVLFALGWTGLISPLPGLQTAAGHAHELLFGFALAVVCGFLVNRSSGPRLGLLVMLWLTARLSFLFVPDSLLAALSNIGFAAVLAATAAPRFMKAAKKWRNRLTGPLVLALATAAAVFHVLLVDGHAGLIYGLLGEAVLLFALLMLFFGGRLIAPAAAGAIERHGGRLEARVQPRIEGAILLAMIGAVVTGLIPAAEPLHGTLVMIAGVLALLRLLRWQLWRCHQRPDLLCLGVGYAWLGGGLVLFGLARGFDLGLSPTLATHVITVGALGTLTSNVMLRTRMLRLRHSPQHFVWVFVSLTGLIALATLARLIGADSSPGLLFAAGAWALAYGLLFVVLMGVGQSVQPG